MTDQPLVRRRALLTGSVAAAFLAGCGQAPTTPSGQPSPGFVSDRGVTGLLSGKQFVVAHRGSGDNWPEHTLQAYQKGLEAGADAVEISVRRTADDVLVCHHDADTRRVTGVPGLVADATFDELAKRPVNARGWLGQATELQPIPRLTDVLAALPPTSVVFIEDKDGTNTPALLDLLDQQPAAKERFVWKQWAAARQVGAARARGYRSWGFFTADLVGRIDEFVGDHDMLGVMVEQDDDTIKRMVALGKPVIAWEVHTRYQSQRLRSLGVVGLMCSNVPYVSTSAASGLTSSFATGRRAAGDLPPKPAAGWAEQPAIVPGVDTISLAGAASRYCLGSLAPIAAAAYTLTAEIGRPSGSGARAGLAFGLESDAGFHPRQANASGAYLVHRAADSTVSLAYLGAGSANPEVLATMPVTDAGPVAVSVRVDPQRLTLSVRQQSHSVNHSASRGGYLWLWAEQPTDGVRLGKVVIQPG